MKRIMDANNFKGTIRRNSRDSSVFVMVITKVDELERIFSYFESHPLATIKNEALALARHALSLRKKINSMPRRLFFANMA